MLENTSEITRAYARAVKSLNTKTDALGHALPELAVRKGLKLADATRQLFAAQAGEDRARKMFADAKREADNTLNAIGARAEKAAAQAKRIRSLAVWVQHGEGWPGGDIPSDILAAALSLRAEMAGTTDPVAKDAARKAAADLGLAALHAEQTLAPIPTHCRKNRSALLIAREKAKAKWLRRTATTTTNKRQAAHAEGEAARIERRVKTLTQLYRSRYRGEN